MNAVSQNTLQRGRSREQTERTIRRLSIAAAAACACGAVICLFGFAVPVVRVALVTKIPGMAQAICGEELFRLITIAEPEIVALLTDGTIVSLLSIPDTCTAFMGFLACTAGAWFFRGAARLGQPFGAGSARLLRIIALGLVALAVVPWAVTMLYSVLTEEAAGGAPDFSYLVHLELLNVPMLVAGLLVGTFAEMSAYGEILQIQDDGLL